MLLSKKLGSHNQVATLVKMSLQDGMLRLLDLVGITLLAESFLPPPKSCFLRKCTTTSLSPDSMFFLPLTTSALSVTVDSTMSAPTGLAAGTKKF